MASKKITYRLCTFERPKRRMRARGCMAGWDRAETVITQRLILELSARRQVQS